MEEKTEKTSEKTASEDYGIGLLSDLIPESENPVRIWNTLCSNITEEETSPGRVQKIILGFLSRHSRDEASHEELVAVSYKLMDTLLRDIRGISTEEEAFEDTYDDLYGEDVKGTYIQKDKQDQCGVIAIKEGETWFHVHESERVPKEGWTIAIHPRLEDPQQVESVEITETDLEEIVKGVQSYYP